MSIKTEVTTVAATPGAEETDRNEDTSTCIQVSISNSHDPTGRLIDTDMSSDTPPHEWSMDIKGIRRRCSSFWSHRRQLTSCRRRSESHE